MTTTTAHRLDPVEPPSPWYVHLLAGHAFSGILPWFLVSRQFFRQGRRGLAATLFLANLAIFIAFCLAGLKLKTAWHMIFLVGISFNLAWSLSAWLCQRCFLGPAPSRYRLEQWRDWLVPVFTALAIAAGLSVLYSISPMIQERAEMTASQDILDKRLILWDFFQFIPVSLPYGLLVGFWWAGLGRRFSSANVITCLAGLCLWMVFLTSGSLLLLFVVFKGQMVQDPTTQWNVIPRGLNGLRRFLQAFQDYNDATIILAPLLLGAASGVRDFWKRAFAVFPFIFVCLIGPGFVTNEMWPLIQGQIVHELSAPDKDDRHTACQFAEVLLRRFPDHDRWPEIGIRLAREYYREKDLDGARAMYQEIIDRFGSLPLWQETVEIARAALASEKFGNEQALSVISMPLVDHAPYLTPNWMALMSVIRFWRGAEVAESEILIQLKSLSKSDETIELAPMPGLAELDDNSASLGYETMIMASSLDRIRLLLGAGIPLILPRGDSFFVINGIDDGRGLLVGHSYNNISARVRRADKGEAKEILSIQEEGKGESVERLTRIAEQAYAEIPFTFLQGPIRETSMPLMAVVHPAGQAERIATALVTPLAGLRQESKGVLAGLIAIAALDSADPEQCVRWARLGAGLTEDPLPLYAAGLAARFWNNRAKLPLASLGLEEKFPALAKLTDFFQDNETKAFMDRGWQRLERDLEEKRLPWTIRRQLSDFLDRSDKDDLRLALLLARHDVASAPANRRAWLDLADLHEWRDETEEAASALESAQAAGAWNDEIAQRLALLYVRLEQRDKARLLMSMLDPAKVGNDAHYHFCVGVLAEWDGNPDQALDYYGQAIEMRRYVPLYHLYYGRLLAQQDQKAEARKVLLWAMQIDARGNIREKAEALLKGI